MEEVLETVVDWTLDKPDFRRLIDKMIKTARQMGKVLPLPFSIETGTQALALHTLVMASISCEGCDALCCRENVGGSKIDLLPPEAQYLAEKHPDRFTDGKLTFPCPFLKSRRCEIYEDRPLVCAFYPWQPGGQEGITGENLYSVASSCPEARRLAKKVYMASYEMRHAYAHLGEQFAEYAFSGLVLGQK